MFMGECALFGWQKWLEWIFWINYKYRSDHVTCMLMILCRLLVTFAKCLSSSARQRVPSLGWPTACLAQDWMGFLECGAFSAKNAGKVRANWAELITCNHDLGPFIPLQPQLPPLSWEIISAAAAAKSLQSCPTLCDPRDCSLPGFPVPGILQARVLEWGAIAFSEISSSGSKWVIMVPCCFFFKKLK